MRLIDADKLYDWVRRECNPYGNPTIDFESGNRMLDMIKRSSTVFDKKKVIEDLNDWMKDAEKWAAKYDEVGDTDNMDLQDMAARCYKNAIEIVEKGGIE